jgi:hypothetical protein
VTQTWWSGNRRKLYAVANAVVFLIAMVSVSQGGSLSHAAYTVALFALCSAPILVLERFNGQYALLSVFMAIYFVFYGMLDLMTMLAAPGLAVEDDSFSAGELGILTGAVLVFLSYSLVAAAVGSRRPTQPPRDIPPAMLGVVGTLLWLVGSLCWVYFQVFVLSDKSNAAGARGLASLGQTKTFFIFLAGLFQPLGILLLAYSYARYRTFGSTVRIIVVVVAQVCMGFLADIKSSAMLAGVLVILTRTLVDNRLPKGWLLGGALFIFVAFPVFQAYRSEVTGERGINRTQAAMDIGKVVEIAISSRDKVARSRGEGHAPSFFERSSLKGSVEIAFERTGDRVPFQDGRTLLDLPYAFIPRIIWPEKPSVPTGQLFNRQFFGGNDDTYVSPSHLGELYWNFGWPGVIFGMSIIGSILGFIAARTNLSRGLSLTRILVLIVTIKGLCMEFEGSIAVAYVVWLRSLAATGVIHLLFARAPATPAPDSSIAVTETEPTPVRFPNLMRS